VTYTVRGEQFIPDKPSVWIDKLPGTMWDLDPRNSKRIAVVTKEKSTEAPEAEHEVVLLLNFFDELRRRVPLTK